MKKKKIKQRLATFQAEKKYVRLTRKRGDFEGISTGFILAQSNEFILLQESDEFRILGYQIFPLDTIKHVRHNKNDKTYERILREEGLVDTVTLKYPVDLTSWERLLEDVQKTGFTVISECEHPKQNYFCIGNIQKIGKKSVSIRYFNAQGILDTKNTKHRFKEITKLSFDDHYANVFSKYVVEG